MEVTLVATDQDSKKKIRSEAIVVIPAHNEERFIGSVVLKARKYADAVLVVDDGSTDATAEIAEAAGAMVVQHARNRGKGVALTTGFRSALGLDPAAVITLDGDFQHLPEEMPAIVGPVLDGSADIVVGSRYLANLSAVPLHRIWGHRAFTLLTNLLSGVGVTDSQSGFRAFSRRAIEAISFQSEGFSVESEMQFLAQEHNLRMVEVPVTIRYPDKPKRPVWAHGLHVLNGVLRLVGRYRPLLFFGVPGMLALLAGLGWGWVVVDIFSKKQTLAVGYALLSVLLTILGSLGLFAGILLHSIRAWFVEFARPTSAARPVSAEKLEPT